MKKTDVFQLISDIFKNEEIQCVLIGGFAVNYYKVTRQTADVDFLITKKDFEKISVSLKKAGYKKDFAQDVFARCTSDNFLMDIDFMFVDKETLDKIMKDGEKISIAGQKFIVPSLNNLIALKLHSIKHNKKIREFRDLPDIINLIRVNNLDFNSPEFKELCLKYGTEEIYQKLLTSLKE
ncbi:MAG: nucleotidyltransferase [bacterium]|nr:nucleotidyltransferase [bacterium]